VLEQNVEGSPVVRTQLFFKSVPATTADNTGRRQRAASLWCTENHVPAEMGR